MDTKETKWDCYVTTNYYYCYFIVIIIVPILYAGIFINCILIIIYILL